MPACARSSCREPEKFSDLLKGDDGVEIAFDDIPEEQKAAIEVELRSKATEKYGDAVTEEKFSAKALASLEEVSIPALESLPTEVKDKLEDPANVKIVDDTTYVSKIQVCRQSADSEQITGVKVTFKNAGTGIETEGEIEGNVESECPSDKVIELEKTDCITRLNIAFDDAGNGHSLIFRRREGTDEETMGLKVSVYYN